jgi:hypothetical protein
MSDQRGPGGARGREGGREPVRRGGQGVSVLVFVKSCRLFDVVLYVSLHPACFPTWGCHLFCLISVISLTRQGWQWGGASYADGWVRRAQWGGEEESQVLATPWMPFSSVEVDDLCKSNVICLTRQGWHEGKVKCR